MTFSHRTRLLTFGLSAILAVGVIGAGVALAQDGGESPPPAEQRKERREDAGHRVLKGILHSVYENSGLPMGTFKEGLGDGKSINQVLAENGVDSATVQAAVLADVDAKLDALVAAGELDATQAARIYAAAQEQLPKLMDRIPNPDRGAKERGAQPGHRVLKGILHSVYENSGLPTGTFKEGFAAGKSINQVLAENNVDSAAVRVAVLADVDAKLDALVAAGELDATQAARIHAAAEEQLPRLMDRVPNADRQGQKPGARVLHGIKSFIGSAAQALGLEPRDFASRLKAGETPADIAAAQGISSEALVAAILTDANARVDAAVAAGTIDAATGAEITSKLEARIETWVTEGVQ